MSCTVVVFSVVSGLATAAMAVFSWRLYRSTEQFRKWTVSQHEPEPTVVGGRLFHVIKPDRELRFSLNISNPGDGPLVLLGVGISQWEKVAFESIELQTLMRLVKPHEMETVELSLPVAKFPDSADLTETLSPKKRPEVIVTVSFLSGNRGPRSTSAKLRVLWYEPPFRGITEGVAWLWPATLT